MGPQFEAAAKKRSDLTLVRVDINNWDSAVARQFAIQSLPNLILYNPQGEVLKRGRAAVGHELMPAQIADGSDESSGGDFNGWLIVIPALAGFLLLLFVLTKALGPKR